MVRKRRKIVTTNKEIYDKFNQLHFSSDVLLTGVKKSQIDRILKSVNNKSEILSSEIIGDYVIVRKNGPLNFNIYLR